MTCNTLNNYLTVVIPTRGGCDTLEHTLRTCVMQEYKNLEIIVSDNYSQDKTREVVESYQDHRIRYINTGKRLSMSDNFEFALSYVKPRGYVIYLGDDDGLLPNAIYDINALLLKTGAQVLRWNVASYFWPNLEGNQANQLNIPSLKSNISKQRSDRVINQVISFEEPYQSLPLLYIYSAIAYDIIEEIKKLSGRFYHSMTPDVYSGFAVAGCVNNFINTTRPYAIGGSSQHSNGASNAGSTSSKAVLMFLSEDNLSFHNSLVRSASVDAYVIESYFQAKDHLPFFDSYRFDMEKLIFQMMKTAIYKPQAVYNEIKDAVLNIGKMHCLTEIAQKAIDENPKQEIVHYNKSIFCRLRDLSIPKIYKYLKKRRNSQISVNCSAYGVKNIYEASLLCDRILRHKYK